MKPYRTARIIWTFYKSYFFSSIIITAICLGLFRKFGMNIFTVIFWFKIATLAITWYFINARKKKEYYYYLNLGVSKLFLWIATLTFDVILFLFLIVQTYKFR